MSSTSRVHCSNVLPYFDWFFIVPVRVARRNSTRRGPRWWWRWASYYPHAQSPLDDPTYCRHCYFTEFSFLFFFFFFCYRPSSRAYLLLAAPPFRLPVAGSVYWSIHRLFFSDWKLVWSIDRTLSLNRFRCRSRKNDCPIVDRLCNRFNARASSECCRFFSLFLSRFTQEKLSTVDVFSIQVPSLALATGPTPLGGASMQSATNDHQFT